MAGAYRSLTTPDVLENALAPLDVLLVPNGDAETAYDELGPAGREALRTWLADGGTLVTWRGGTQLAALMELTTAELAEPTSDVPGSLIRANVARTPLARGVGSSVWSFYEYDFVMSTADAASVAVRSPTRASPRWFVSGFEDGAEELGGTAAVVDEPYADGRVVAFAAEPNFRAFTDGTQKILWNAVYGRRPDRAQGPAECHGGAAPPGGGRRAVTADVRRPRRAHPSRPALGDGRDRARARGYRPCRRTRRRPDPLHVPGSRR